VDPMVSRLAGGDTRLTDLFIIDAELRCYIKLRSKNYLAGPVSPGATGLEQFFFVPATHGGTGKIYCQHLTI
jgi:hypothetical protein